MTLRPAAPEEAGFLPGGMEEVDRVIRGFLEQKAFPGAVVAVGHRGALAHLRPFGRLSYDEGAPAVRADTIYDLASLTKVVATTTMAMILVDEGALDLGSPVGIFFLQNPQALGVVVVIADRDGEHLLRLVLPDHEPIEVLLDVTRSVIELEDGVRRIFRRQFLSVSLILMRLLPEA